MINKVTIENFMSHKKTILEFGAGINMIHGKSDCGKSAILKAMNWVINNKPNGDSFCSHWGGDTKVTLEFDDHVLARVKSKKLNGYVLNGTEFKALGGKVPEEIQTALNMSEVNMQSQFDSFYLLNDSPGEVAKKLNKAINLSIIDDVTTKIKKLIKDTKAEVLSYGRLLITANERADTFPDLELIEKDINKLQVTSEYITAQKPYIDKLDTTLDSLDSLEESIGEQKIYLDALTKKVEGLESLQAITEEVDTLETRCSSLEELVDTICGIEETIEGYKDTVNKLNDVVVKHTATAEMEGVDVDKPKRLYQILNTINDNQEIVDVYKKDLKRYKKSLKELQPDECPLCGK